MLKNVSRGNFDVCGNFPSRHHSNQWRFSTRSGEVTPKTHSCLITVIATSGSESRGQDGNSGIATRPK